VSKFIIIWAIDGSPKEGNDGCNFTTYLFFS